MTKTCGNCGNPCGRENCGFWEPNNEVLEQRYQQLAEVARDLWQYIADRAPNMPQSVFILGQTAEQLEKLGVMVDD